MGGATATAAPLVATLWLPHAQGAHAMSDNQRRNEAGEEWAGFLCFNPACGLPLLVMEIRPEMLDATGAVTIGSRNTAHKLTCRSCGNESVYQTTQLQRFRTAEKGRLN